MLKRITKPTLILVAFLAIPYLAGYGVSPRYLAVYRSADDDSLSIDERFQFLAAPGAIVGVFDHRGDEIWFADFRNPVLVDSPLARDDHFRIASLSKLFLGYCVLDAVREGKLQLSDSVDHHCPGLRLPPDLTVQMVGTHHSGLAEPAARRSFQQQIMKSPARHWSLRELLDQIDIGDISTADRSFEYSNANAWILAQVLVSIYNQPYPEIVRHKILDPWALANTGFASSELPTPFARSYRFAAPGRPFGFGGEFIEVTHYGGGWAGPAGDMYSTIDDLAVAIPRLANTYQKMADGTVGFPSWQPAVWESTDYGFMIERVDGWIGHCGNLPGYNVAAHYHPDLRRTVIAVTNLSNCQDGQSPAEALARSARRSEKH